VQKELLMTICRVLVGLLVLATAPAGETAHALASDPLMTVTLLGTGTPILNFNRFGMSTLVQAGTQKFLFDAGRGAAIRLHQAKVPLRDITAVFITHLHSDHLTGLPDLYATAPLPTDDGRRTLPFEVYGPQGIDDLGHGIERMFTQNNQIRVIGNEADPRALTISTYALAPEAGVVFSRDGVIVTAFLVDHGHARPAYGYRIDYAGHAVVLSGDTTYTPNLVAHAKDVDLLIHCLAVASRQLEAAAPDYVNHFYEYLANPEMVGRILGEVRPRDAAFSHISLYSRGQIERATEDEITARVKVVYDGPFIVGQDLMSFTISPRGLTRLPYDASMRQREPLP
jgi:ribonuclease Z